MKKWVPLIIIAIALIAFFLLGMTKYFSFTTIKKFEPELIQFVASHPVLSPLLFTALYAVSVILFLPVGIFLSIAGGFFFHHPVSELCILVGSTVGACILFLLVRGPLHALYLNRAGTTLKKIEQEFEKSSINYLLFLRLLPFSPFWLVNLACAFFGVPFWTFAWTTFVGNIIPVVIFVEIGTELGTLLKSGQDITIGSLLSWQVILLLLALAFFSLLPIFFKKR